MDDLKDFETKVYSIKNELEGLQQQCEHTEINMDIRFRNANRYTPITTRVLTCKICGLRGVKNIIGDFKDVDDNYRILDRDDD